MQFPHFRMRSRLALAMVASLAAFVAHTSAVTKSAEDAPPTAASAAAAAASKKSKVHHFARVNSDGTLVNGTAISAERFNDGIYYIRFAEPISDCGGAANSAAFPGFDISVFRIMAQINIGVGPGGIPDDVTVGVNLFDLTGFGEDSAFTIVLSCP